MSAATAKPSLQAGMDVSASKPEGYKTETDKLKPLDKSGHWANMTAEQQDVLSKFEQTLEKQGCLPDEHLKEQEQRAIVLSRFLRARDWNIDNAVKMYQDTWRWRKEVDIDTIVKPVDEGGYDFSERKVVAEHGWKMCECME